MIFMLLLHPLCLPAFFMIMFLQDESNYLPMKRIVEHDNDTNLLCVCVLLVFWPNKKVSLSDFQSSYFSDSCSQGYVVR